MAKLEDAINSSKFQTAVLRFNGFQFLRFTCLPNNRVSVTELKKFTNPEIYEIMMGGHRREGKDSFMDLKLTLSIDKKDGVVGETDSNNVTTTYIEAFNRMNEGELASHYAHEYTHTLGFQH